MTILKHEIQKRIFLLAILAMVFVSPCYAADGDPVREGKPITGTLNIGSGGLLDIVDVTDGNLPYMSATGFGDSPLSTDGTDLTVGNDINITGNIEAATYGSGANPISDATLLGIDDGTALQVLIGGGVNVIPVWEPIFQQP